MDRGDLTGSGERVREGVGRCRETGRVEYWNCGRRDDESVADEGGDEVGETVYAVESVGGGVGGRVAVGYNRR